MILNIGHRVDNALRFVDANSAPNTNKIWMAFAQQAAWPDPANPPAPDPNATTLNTPLAAALCNFQFVFEDDISGLLTFTEVINSQTIVRKFTPFANRAAALAGNCTMILVNTLVLGSDLLGAGMSSFGQRGLFSGLVAAGGHTSDTFLASTNVISFGTLETTDNNIAQPISSAVSITTYMLLEF